MRILLMPSAYNSMSQRLHVELADRGHEVSVELAPWDDVVLRAVRALPRAAARVHLPAQAHPNTTPPHPAAGHRRPVVTGR
jgi:hypothetical protein